MRARFWPSSLLSCLSARRLWCRALCPLGGTFQVLGRAGQVNVAIDHDACIHCDKCTHVCLADPEILAPALVGEDTIVRAGDCMACGACVDVCPTSALRFRFGAPAVPKRVPKADRREVAKTLMSQ